MAEGDGVEGAGINGDDIVRHGTVLLDAPLAALFLPAVMDSL
jgi:hypothetical protein